ncbi:MAG: hypothetical protein RLZZ618_149 [Pseudomonadota bacterium]|jgi:UDPglucose 6-dehydrogenase
MVVGLGPVGLAMAAGLAELGHQVVALDEDEARVQALQAGRLPFFEPDLEPLITAGLTASRLRFTRLLDDALELTDAVFLAVGTPALAHGATDLTALHRVADAVADALTHDTMLVIKSTVPVGTAERLRERVAARLAQRGLVCTVPVVSNPEFLREGSAVHDVRSPDRLLAGVGSESEAALLRRIYAPLLARGVPLLIMDTRSAELAKYAANAMLAARISLMNEMASLADATGADIEAVRQALGLDHRIGSAFLQAGAGFGGSCFPKDLSALQQLAAAKGVQVPVIDGVVQTNTRQKQLTVERLFEQPGGRAAWRGRHVAVWGLAFKPHTDDVREAPSLTVIRLLIEAGCTVAAHDPVANANAARALGNLPGVRFGDDALAVLPDADALLLLTEWPVFQSVLPADAARLMRGRVVIDGRNVLDAGRWAAEGLAVRRIGRPDVAAQPRA